MRWPTLLATSAGAWRLDRRLVPANQRLVESTEEIAFSTTDVDVEPADLGIASTRTTMAADRHVAHTLPARCASRARGRWRAPCLLQLEPRSRRGVLRIRVRRADRIVK